MTNLRQTNGSEQPLIVESIGAPESEDPSDLKFMLRAGAAAALIIGATVAAVGYINGDDQPDTTDAAERAVEMDKRQRAFHAEMYGASDQE